MKQIRTLEQIGLIFTIFFFWLAGDGDLLLLRQFKSAEWLNLGFTAFVVYASWGLFRWSLQTVAPLRETRPAGQYYLIQILTTSSVMLTFIYLANYLYIYHFWQMTFEQNYFREVIFPLACLFAGLWNVLDFGFRLYQDKSMLLHKLSDTAAATPQKDPELLIKQGKQLIKVPHRDLAYITVSDHLTWAVTTDERRYYLDQPLNQIQESLNGREFFRVNRQTILAKSAIESVRKEKNQKLSVQVQPQLSFFDRCSVSRYKSADFLAWWQS